MILSDRHDQEREKILKDAVLVVVNVLLVQQDDLCQGVEFLLKYWTRSTSTLVEPISHEQRSGYYTMKEASSSSSTSMGCIAALCLPHDRQYSTTGLAIS